MDINNLLRWNGTLPGKSAQDIMIPHPDRNKYKVVENHKKAGVMILLFQKEEIWHLVLIKRTQHPNDKHSGQISLPGGQLDKRDKDIRDCAIRETHEEIGVRPSDIKILQSLTPIYVPVSQFMVYPQVGFYNGEISTFRKQDDEVESMIFVPLEHLLNDQMIQKKDIIIRERLIKSVPYFKIGSHIIWGATAMILSEFKQWIKEIS